ncbi:MAG: PLP-dependent transferase [Planctomycetaceae bacterium]|nr:PLP-dependent transferase [Planctomycetaceae bacterium]
MTVDSAENLLLNPRWQAQDLGLPMPNSVHAASACLPLWEHNVRYEEGDPEVVGKLESGYPRFCFHPLVRKLCRQTFGEEGVGLIFPTHRVAQRAADFVVHRGGQRPQLIPLGNDQATGVRTGTDDFGKLKEYWQHSGEILSSRSAERMLAGCTVTYSQTAERQKLRERLAEFGGCHANDVWLFPCGMTAIATVWRAIEKIRPGLPSVQFGFPYVDTLKIQQRFGAGKYHFLPQGNTNALSDLRELLRTTPVSAVYCETPTNPLLTSPDLKALRALADEFGFLLVVDDTLAAIVNDNVLPFADVAVTSLTKFFSGYGDVLAGSARLNHSGRYATALRAALVGDFEELLSDADAEVLERNSRDVRDRMKIINHNAAVLAERFAKHTAVDRVHYPDPGAAGTGQEGRGGLMSVVLKNPSVMTPIVYDRLRICKGPNLGTNFTLCCPYTILAHYTELDAVEECGVSRWLLRISVGVEPVEELWQRFESALNG